MTKTIRPIAARAKERCLVDNRMRTTRVFSKTAGQSLVMAHAAPLPVLAEWARDEGMVVSDHHHTGAPMPDAEHSDWLMEGAIDDPSLLYDTGHLACAGADPVSDLDRWDHAWRRSISRTCAKECWVVPGATVRTRQAGL